MAPCPFNPQLFQMATRTHVSQTCGYVDLQGAEWRMEHMLRKLLSNSTTISVDSIQCMCGHHQQMVHA